MIKQEAINTLIETKVVPVLAQELEKDGFKYLKSKRCFSRKAKDGIVHNLNLYVYYSPIYYNEDTEQIFLDFTIYASFDIPAFKKWYLTTFGEKDLTFSDSKTVKCKIELSVHDFTEESYSTPTPNQRFKMSVLNSFVGDRNLDKTVVPMDLVLQEEVPRLIAFFQDKTDILTLFHHRDYPFACSFLLLFAGYTDLAKQQFKVWLQYRIDEIEAKLKNDPQEAAESLKYFEDYLLQVNKVTNLVLENPFLRTIKVLPPKGDEFVFSSKTKFSELLRLDLSKYLYEYSKIYTRMNGLGEMLILADKKIIKLNLQGEVVFEQQYEAKPGFDQSSSYLSIRIIDGTNDFFVSNWIIKSNNQLLDLPLPSKNLKKGKPQSIYFNDLAFWKKENKYVALYEQDLLIYSDQGVLEHSKEVDISYGHFIMEKEWIVSSDRQNNTHQIHSFDGETIGTYDFSNGNHKYAYSKNHEYLICFNYAITSQLYKLPSGKKETLKAHPTHINGYKEVGYPDTEHNFGLDIAKFSPDSTYIVGCAYHGRYVAWKLPKLERVDLVPQAEMIDLLTPRESLKSVGDGFEKVIIKPSFFSAGGQSFLKNFNFNEISNIFFFENGDIFITEIGRGKFVLTWDRDFNNLNFRKLEGILNLFAEKYLTQTTETELIIYELQS
jgi:hypothetical protein